MYLYSVELKVSDSSTFASLHILSSLITGFELPGITWFFSPLLSIDFSTLLFRNWWQMTHPILTSWIHQETPSSRHDIPSRTRSIFTCALSFLWYKVDSIQCNTCQVSGVGNLLFPGCPSLLGLSKVRNKSPKTETTPSKWQMGKLGPKVEEWLSYTLTVNSLEQQALLELYSAYELPGILVWTSDKLINGGWVATQWLHFSALLIPAS